MNFVLEIRGLNHFTTIKPLYNNQLLVWSKIKIFSNLVIKPFSNGAKNSTVTVLGEKLKFYK